MLQIHLHSITYLVKFLFVVFFIVLFLNLILLYIMSFSRAKLQRFNDTKPCTPSPAHYNTQGKKISRNANSECGSTKSSPCFRTPTVLRKKKTVPEKASSSKELFPSITPEVEALREKITECENKDAYIKELMEQMEDIKNSLQMLEIQKNQMEKEKSELEDKITRLHEEFEKKSADLNELHEKEINNLNIERCKVDEELCAIKKEYELLKEERCKDLIKLRENFDEFEQTYAKSVEEHNHLIEDKNKIIEQKETELQKLEHELLQVQQQHALDCERMIKNHENDIQDIEYEMLKVMNELEKEKQNTLLKIKEVEKFYKKEIQDLQEGFINEKEKIKLETDARIKQVEENFKEISMLSEIQVEEKIEEIEKNWKLKLKEKEKECDAILLECQEIGEYSVMQCEIEKNQVKSLLAEKVEENKAIQTKYNNLINKYNELNTKFTELQEELKNAQEKLKTERMSLSEELEKKDKEIVKIIGEKRTFQLTITKLQETIDVLKTRLLHSDHDVEQLKQEIELCEDRLLQYENKMQNLQTELQSVQQYIEELEMQNESTCKINETRIKFIEKYLLSKVDSEIQSIQNNKGNELLHQAMEQLKEQTEKNIEAYALIEQTTEKLDRINLENEQLLVKEKDWINEKKEWNECIENWKRNEQKWIERENELKENIKQTSMYKELSECANEEILNLKKLIGQMEAKTEYLEYYKNKVKDCEKEIEEMSGINKKYIEQSGKFDEMLQKYEALERDSQEKNKNFEELLEKYKALEIKHNESHTKYELEKNSLLNKNSNLEEQIAEVSNKYASLLGNHNYKQKIKHVQDLKEKNCSLAQDKTDLETKLSVQKSENEKLKKENEDLKKYLTKIKKQKKDKENISSPTRPVILTRTESPGPLRELNLL